MASAMVTTRATRRTSAISTLPKCLLAHVRGVSNESTISAPLGFGAPFSLETRTGTLWQNLGKDKLLAAGILDYSAAGEGWNA
jgi:hypothetical protein